MSLKKIQLEQEFDYVSIDSFASCYEMKLIEIEVSNLFSK